MENDIFPVLKSTANESKDKKIYMTVDGAKCEVFVKNGSLLEKNEKLYFDPLYILEQAKNKVIRDFRNLKIRIAIFIKSSFFGDDGWHFDDYAILDLEKGNNGNKCYISNHSMFYGGRKKSVGITTDGLKVFVGSVFFERGEWDSLPDNKKIQASRDNGFVEVDLYKISYFDQKTNKYITKKAFLTSDFSESETIDKSIVAIEKDESNVVGKMYKIPEQKKEVWRELKSRSEIISKKAWVMNCVLFKINRSSLALFLNNILGQNNNLTFELEINGVSCEKQSNAFSVDYKNGTKEIVVEYADGRGIYSLCLKVFNGTNKDPIKPFLFLQKDGKDLCIFAGNKKTDIKVTEDTSRTLKNWGENFLNNKYKTKLKPVSNNSFSISKLSNQIELPTPGERKPMQINIGENQK